MIDAGTGAGNRLHAAAVSCAGLGFLPVANRLVVTLAGAGLALALIPLRDESWFHFGAAMALVVALCVGFGLASWSWIQSDFEGKKPGFVVLDDLVAFSVALFRLDSSVPSLKELVFACLVVRLFRSLRPLPSEAVAKWPHGRGLVLEGAVAGVYASMLIYVVRDYFHWEGWSGFTL